MTANEIITTNFQNFTVDGVTVPVVFLNYDGSEDAYVVYMETDKDPRLNSDDELNYYMSYYDFDIYTKGNYKKIAKELKTRLENIGFTWQPGRDSEDMYETETGLYHKTLCFSIVNYND